MNINFKLVLLILMLMLIFTANAQNTKLALLKSAILPGWGELSNNHKSGYIFLSTEVAFWLSRYYFLNESDLYEQSSYEYAIKHAHIESSLDFDDVFYDNLKRYLSSGYDAGGYNANIVFEAKNTYPHDVQAQQDYILENSYDESHYWYWDSKDHRDDYKILRKRITEYKDYAKAMTGFIIVNHIVSAFNSTRISSKLKHINVNVGLNNTLSPMITCNYRF